MATRSHQAGPIPDRSSFTPLDTVKHIWTRLNLPETALRSLRLEDATHHFYPSSFQIDHLAQSTIALSALAAALAASLHAPSKAVPQVSIPLKPATLAFRTERLYSLDANLPASTWGPIGGLHATADGHVRIHDNFPHHRDGALALLGLHPGASRAQVAAQARRWRRFDLEDRAAAAGLPIYALRTYAEWDAHPVGVAVGGVPPVTLRKLDDAGPTGLPSHMSRRPDRCLRGLRVLELSRVIAAPVAGQTLAAHGADVLWITSPSLPDLPDLDRCLARGKRSVQLDLDVPSDRAELERLVRDADVWLQGYRPGALASKGFGSQDLMRLNPGIIIANLSAFPADGPWAQRRGFDSLVQTCSGMNASEAAHAGTGVAQPMPCQALDHGAGYLLAAGVAGAVWRRAVEGGSWEVSVSLAGVGAYLRSLGQVEGRMGFETARGVEGMEELEREDEGLFEGRPSGFGMLKALRHAAEVEEMMPGWDLMPKPLGSDEARWS